MKVVPELTDLPAEILVNIFSYCCGIDILNTSEAFNSDKIEAVVPSNTLWKKAVIGPENPRGYLKFLGPHTTKVTIRGFVKLNKNFRPTKTSWEQSEQLSASVIESLRLRCPNLSSLSLYCCVLDVTNIIFSLFPKTLHHLELDSVQLVNLPQGHRLALSASPFLNIKKHLPSLLTLTFTHPFYLRPVDSLSIISGCKYRPELTITDSSHTYDFSPEGREEMGRGGRRIASKHFRDLIDFHYTKKSYNTRAVPPS